MDALSLTCPSWNRWDSPSICEEKCDTSSSETFDSAEFTCLNPSSFQNGQRTKSFNDISNQKMVSVHEKSSRPVMQEPFLQHNKERWNIPSTSVTPSISYECVSNLGCNGPNNMTKSLVDVTASRSNVSIRSSSFFRKCNSTASLPSAFLDQMIDQLRGKGIQIPTKDRKILELMISRHENYIEERERSYSTHQTWDEEKLNANERHNREEREHRQHILHKMQAEKKLRNLKKLEMLEKEKAEIDEKERILKYKTEKWNDRWDEQESARREDLLRIKMRENDRKRAQEKYLREKMEVEELSKKMLAMDSDCRLVKSIQSRHCQEVESLIKLKKESIESEDRHASRMKEVQQHLREKLDLLKEDLEIKDCIMSRNRSALLHELEMKCRREAEERRHHTQNVHEVLEKLEKSNQLWYEEVMVYQQHQLQMVEERAQRHLENRVYSVRKERMQKMQRHERHMQKIHNQQKRDLLLASHKLNLKQKKCEHLALEKECKIQQSRQTAQASSDLRERLKWVLEQDILGRKFPLLDPHSQMNTAPPSELSTFN